jgi:hypothetical protein
VHEESETTPRRLAALHARSDAVCRTEMERLTRRVPTLTEAQQHVVRAALDDLAEELLLSRMRRSALRPAVIAELFGSDDPASRPAQEGKR